MGLGIVDRLTGLEKIYFDQQYCAKAAGLNYVNGQTGGYKRIGQGKRIKYAGLNDKEVTDNKVIGYCRSLAIPPAWREVWINKDKSGHLLATGVDEKGRKQYLYHPRWRSIRSLLNGYRVLLLAVSLPKIRTRIRKYLGQDGLRRRKVTAAVIRIMMYEPIRIGNKIYEETNNSYGLTTLKKRHIEIKGRRIRFEFRGKSGKCHKKVIKDKKLAEFLKEVQEIGGKKLFRYRNRQGTTTEIRPEDVNEALRRISGFRISAKDFRTWLGSLEVYSRLKKQDPPQTQRAMITEVNKAADAAAEMLGNTRAMAKKAYIHPRLVQSFEDGSFFEKARAAHKKAKTVKMKLKKEEKELVVFLSMFWEKDLKLMVIS